MTDGIKEKELFKLKQPLKNRWRVQRAYPNKANPTHVILVAFVDARDVQNKLDEVCGIGNWQSKFYEVKGKQFCEIGIKVNRKDEFAEWIWKGDSGSEAKNKEKNQDPSQIALIEKGETSDAFKRSGVAWGINRIAYSFGEVKLPCKIFNKKPYPCNEKGSFLKGDKLYEACNKMAKVEDFEDLYIEEANNQPNYKKSFD